MDKKLCDQELGKEAVDQVRMNGIMCDGRWSRDLVINLDSGALNQGLKHTGHQWLRTGVGHL